MTQELTVHQKNVVQFRQLAESPAYLNRFKQVLNDRAPQFVASLVQLVSRSSYLAACDSNTIMAAAITSAALDLPIDPNLGFAHIVPYGQAAQFQMGYKGFIQLAIRSGQYKLMNCCVVYKGELQVYNELTAELVLDPAKRESDEVIGYAAYFKLVNGFEHAEYWTRTEVEAHAKHYSQAYAKGKNTPWKTNFDQMALKTVIKSLISHWGIMSIEMQKALTHDQGIRKSIDSDDVAYPDNDPKRPVDDGAPVIDAEEVKTEPSEPFTRDESGNVVGAATVTPYEEIGKLCDRDGVTYHQVLGFMKANKLAMEATTELEACSDANLKAVAQTWPAAVSKIKKFPKE